MRSERSIMLAAITACLVALPILHVGAESTFPSAVYRCVVEEVVTFSDRPCDTQAKRYTPESEWVSTVEVDKSTAPARRARSRQAQRVPSVSIASAQAKHKEECARLEDASREVRSKMRAGYDGKSGERLKDRNRKLNADLRSKRC